MSEFAKPSQSDFIREMARLNQAQRAAVSAEDREAADADLALFLRYSAAGRLPEYFAQRRQA